MNYEILALDIDGTLTNSRKEITEPTLRALLTLQKQGRKIVLASGRPTPGLTPYAEQLQLAQYGGYLLAYNGAKIVHYQTGEAIVNQALPASSIPLLYEFAQQNGLGIVTYEADCVLCGTQIDRYIELEANINHLPIRTISNFAQYVNFPVNKCLMTGEEQKLAQMEQKLKAIHGDALSIYRSEPFFLEIMPQHVDKANSLSKLLSHLHLKKEQLIACGDGYNDISMITFAGLGVAMGNAREEVKAAADFITASNDEDGVLAVIENYMIRP